MKRLTKRTIGCFAYDLNYHEHKVGEFATYEAFYNYSVAVKRLGELEEMEIGNCEGCAWENRKRPQKCSCCRRNPFLKDCYEKGESNG